MALRILVSSAKKGRKESPSTLWSISLIRIRKRIGPKTVHCGTPLLTVENLDLIPFAKITWPIFSFQNCLYNPVNVFLNNHSQFGFPLCILYCYFKNCVTSAFALYKKGLIAIKAFYMFLFISFLINNTFIRSTELVVWTTKQGIYTYTQIEIIIKFDSKRINEIEKVEQNNISVNVWVIYL